MVTHIQVHCSKNPLIEAQASQDVENTPLNAIQVINSWTKDEVVVPIQVGTRAQDREKLELKTKELVPAPIKKTKHKCWRERKAHLVAKKLKKMR